jgi:class 3 adenylate cyclase
VTASRTCTILFTDLVGSTELRARLGDDRFDMRRRGHDRLIHDALVRHEGELVKHEGDGVMAVFVSAADALSCAVAVQQGISRDRGRDDAPFIVRIGLSAGDVAEEDGDYHGTPVVEAARLCDAASGDQILAADVVRILAGSRGGHQFVPLGALELKGLADPLVAWDVVWSRHDSRVEMPSRLGEVAARGACVGRDGELETIVTEWKRATTGERRLVLIAGEPGIGKTRLAAELAARVVHHGGIALHGWCDEEIGSPYQPWAQTLGAYVRAAVDEDIEVATAGIADDLSRLVPEISARLASSGPAPAVDAEADRARLFGAVDVLVERVSAQHPMLFVLDDVHWADRPTLGLLRRLLQSDRPGAVLFLATYRDTDVDRRHPLAEVVADLRREPRAKRVALDGLDEAGLGAMLADRAGHDAPPEFVRLLLDETEGNPFFVEEVVALLVETGTIYQRDGVWVSDLSPEELGLPEGVRDVVGRRLSRLSQDANDLLTVAAVVGREFGLAPVIAAGDLDRDVALDSIEAAIGSGLVTEVVQSAGRFSFSHALIRQTLLEEISGARRARLHWRVGDALAASRTASLSTIAFHMCEGVLAGDVARAADAALAAAEHAYAVAAPIEARSLVQRALGVLDDANVDEPKLRCRALLVFGETSAAMQLDYAEARTSVIEAARIAKEHDWSDLATRAATAYSTLFTPGEFDPVVHGLATAALEMGASDADRPVLQAILGMQQVIAGRHDEGVALIDDAVAAAGSQIGRSLMMALALRAQADWGDPDRARLSAHADRALAVAERLGIAVWITAARTSRAMVGMRAGDRAMLEGERNAMAALGDGQSVVVPEVDMFAGALALLDGRFADTERIAIDALGRLDPVSGAWLNANAQLAAVWYWSGRDDELIGALASFPVEAEPQRYLLDLVRISTLARRGERDPQLDELAAGGFASMPRNFHRPGSMCHAGSAVAWLSDRVFAAQLVPVLEPYAGELLIAPLACLVFDAADSVRGMLLMLLDRVDEAIACFEAAAALCKRANDLPHAVMNAHRLAGALLARGDPGDRERACELATTARERAVALGQAPDIRFAQAVLDRG